MQLSISACVIRMVAMDAGRDTDKWTWGYFINHALDDRAH